MTGAPPANTPIQPQSSQPRAIEPSHFTRESDLPLKPASGISNSQPLQPMYKSNKRAPWPTPCHIGLIRSFFPNVATLNLQQISQSHLQGFWYGAIEMDEGLCQQRCWAAIQPSYAQRYHPIQESTRTHHGSANTLPGSILYLGADSISIAIRCYNLLQILFTGPWEKSWIILF